MPYLIDGHNLVPAAGLRLDSIDDETELLSRLQAFCRLTRAKVEVFFDGAPPGFPSNRIMGPVKAHFIRKGSSADSAIETRLVDLGKGARNWTVVSSDRRVQNAAKSAHATVLASNEFAYKMASMLAASDKKSPPDPPLSQQQVDEWMRRFRERDGNN